MRKFSISAAIVMALLLQGCDGDDSGFNGTSKTELADAKIYKADSPYQEVAADCIRATQSNEYCKLSELPLLGMEVSSPSIEDVLDRLVVSHDWMGQRFEALLQRYPAEMLYLFRGITAVVIDDDTRPAYYTAGTGAIYLDPAYLWLTNEEKATINQKDDFRSGYSDPLDFRAVNRYMQGDNPAFYYYSLTGTEERSIEDIELAVARLLLHELAHANDFFPPDRYGSIDLNNSPSQASNKLGDDYISSRLYRTEPLASSRMFSLAEVMYKGKTPSSEDLATTAADVGEAFGSDNASDDYGYTTQYEDIAMLFEESMMKYFWGVDYDTGFIEVPTGCNEAPIVIAWGQRNRVGEEGVKQRAQFVASKILGEVDLTNFFENLGDARDFAANSDWCKQAVFAGEEESTEANKANLRRYSEPLETLKPYL